MIDTYVVDFVALKTELWINFYFPIKRYALQRVPCFALEMIEILVVAGPIPFCHIFSTPSSWWQSCHCPPWHRWQMHFTIWPAVTGGDPCGPSRWNTVHLWWQPSVAMGTAVFALLSRAVSRYWRHPLVMGSSISCSPESLHVLCRTTVSKLSGMLPRDSEVTSAAAVFWSKKVWLNLFLKKLLKLFEVYYIYLLGSDILKSCQTFW